MNRPYTSELGELGKDNPFIHNNPNRASRRALLQKNPFKGNKKGISLSVSGNQKYERTVQEIVSKEDGSIKHINHQMRK